MCYCPYKSCDYEVLNKTDIMFHIVAKHGAENTISFKLWDTAICKVSDEEHVDFYQSKLEHEMIVDNLIFKIFNSDRKGYTRWLEEN